MDEVFFISILSRFVHPSNADEPIAVIELGRLIFPKFVQFENIL